ncbi:MAG: sporulation integral membrane protein YtvI [Clostridium sp.]|nr:sporulation integral membrane protein YtvI [Acetatifactor muris]MCM1526845.1 sporulation integral membrane protein YtvI [Bacteroides sp.]MCM1562955.1 sporulation integral membrane protein YtvI [Clostridium sp.]
MRKYIKATINLVIALIIFLLIIFLAPRLLVFFAPFVAGWIVALIASPLVHFFESKLKIKRKAGSVVVIVSVIGLVVLILYLAGAKLTTEVVGLVNELPDIWENAEEDFAEISQKLSVIYNKLPEDLQQRIAGLGDDITEYLGDFMGNVSLPTIAAVGNFAKQLPSILIGVIMALLSSYLFVAERHNITAWFVRVMPEGLINRYRIIKRSLVKAVGGYLKAQLRIELWMYLLLVIGLTILRVDYALLIALGIAFLDFIPFFGTGTVLVPWALIKILSSDYSMAVGLLIIWGVGQLARQLIQPKIVGESIGVAPIPTLFLLYIGYKLGSVVGMIVAVPIGLIVYTMYEEGAFDTTRNSILILVNGLNRFRRLEPEDLTDVERREQTDADRTRQAETDGTE